jgi:hypothetical protein
MFSRFPLFSLQGNNRTWISHLFMLDATKHLSAKWWAACGTTQPPPDLRYYNILEQTLANSVTVNPDVG